MISILDKLLEKFPVKHLQHPAADLTSWSPNDIFGLNMHQQGEKIPLDRLPVALLVKILQPLLYFLLCPLS
jgi:hypothetical protein